MIRHASLCTPLLTCSLALAGCGADGTRATPFPNGASGSGGSSSESNGAGGARTWDLPDVTFHMDGKVLAGGESQSCQYVHMPSDRGEIAVPSAESTYTPGSHHFLVFRTNFTEIPDDGAIHECSVNDLLLNVSGTYYEAQQPETRRDLPPGVAHVFEPGEIILLTAHYLNATDQDLVTKVDFRMHTMPRKEVEQEAGSFFFYNYDINVPPQSKVSVTRTCPIPKDVNLALLWSHMHARGVGFIAVTSDDRAAERVGNLFETRDWSEPQARAFSYAPPVVLHAGTSITYTCDYDNPTSNTFTQGPSAATNEMCILHGMYWPRLPASVETCLNGTAD
ncbi:MAG TPA: hypothetical protein VHE30_05170 [Polyangiaceae bacterium]|nr:hypothetical protein [Polyangiaceae bacterium]